MAMALVLLPGANALANTVWQVSKSSSNATCSLAKTTCNTIQSAVDAASAFDVIVVGPGTYRESVYVGTYNLTILGTQAGKDARNREPINESIVDATGQGSGRGHGAAFYFDDESDNVVDGFTIQGGTGGAAAAGIYNYIDYTDQYVNNIIQNNAVGIYLCESGEGVLVRHNLIKNNNRGAVGVDETHPADTESTVIPGPGFGVVLYDSGGAVAISQNAFAGNMAVAIFVFNSGGGVEITQNTSNGDGSLAVLYEAEEGVNISQNSGQNFGASGFLPVNGATNADAAIEFFQENYFGEISDNILVGGGAANYSGIECSAQPFSGGAPREVCGAFQISSNRISQFTGNGIVAEAATGDEITMDDCGLSANQVEENGLAGIHIGAAAQNGYNTVSNNHVVENHKVDCQDDTSGSGSGTPATADTWVNNVGWSLPPGLCNYTGE
jgi:parallel beta-helix repeat protein